MAAIWPARRRSTGTRLRAGAHAPGVAVRTAQRSIATAQDRCWLAPTAHLTRALPRAVRIAARARGSPRPGSATRGRRHNGPGAENPPACHLYDCSRSRCSKRQLSGRLILGLSATVFFPGTIKIAVRAIHSLAAPGSCMRLAIAGIFNSGPPDPTTCKMAIAVAEAFSTGIVRNRCGPFIYHQPGLPRRY